MNLLIETFKKQNDYSFAKNVIQNMQYGYTMPFDFISLLDLNRKRIYWNLYFKHLELPFYIHDDGDKYFASQNLLILKNLVKFCPEKIKKDFIEFEDSFFQDNKFKFKFKISCSKIKRQINKLF